MFDLFDPGKLFIVGVVALIVIGPKDLPRVMRTIGQVTGRMRRMAAEFQQQFNEAMREAEMEDVKKELAAINDATKVDVSFDPATLTRHDDAKALESEQASAMEAMQTVEKPKTNGAHVESQSVAEPAMPAPGDPPALKSELAETVAREGGAP
jgi:sec-independent protein translocase protein TatB